MAESSAARPALRYAIVGCGGQIAPTHIQALKALPGARIVAMSDVAPEPGAARAEAVGCPFYLDYRRMLAAVRPDVVVVCTPHPSHAAIAIAALEAGANVLVEKPIAVTVAEADAMIAAAAAAGRILAVSFQHRFEPCVEAMRDLIAAGELGRLVRVECVEPWFRAQAYYRSAAWRSTWRGEGGGVLLNQAIHTLDPLCYLVGLPAVVRGQVSTLGHAVECEDTAHALLEYSGGAPGYFYTSTVEAGLPRHIALVGDRAALDLVGAALTITRFAPPLAEYRTTSAELFGEPAAVRTEVALPPGDGGAHFAVHRDLYDAIVSGRAPRCDGVSGRMALELANAIVLSGLTGEPALLPLDRAAYTRLLTDLQAGTRVVPGALRAGSVS